VRVAVRKWGNSLGVRIPKALAEQAGIANGSAIDLVADGNRLVATPIVDAPTLDDLVAGITPENRHGEVDPPRAQVGREAW
jgi:antitoxin MazE